MTTFQARTLNAILTEGTDMSDEENLKEVLRMAVLDTMDDFSSTYQRKPVPDQFLPELFKFLDGMMENVFTEEGK